MRFILIIPLLFPNLVQGFVPSSACGTNLPNIRLWASAVAKSALESAIDNALIAGEDPIPHIERLEATEAANAQPNRSPDFLGEWYVWWTNCPPPSNGQLGPFSGTSEQAIDSEGAYVNILRVPPNDWLKAVLQGVYEDWNGQILSDINTQGQTQGSEDWGACHWKVTFINLTISLLGIPLIQKEFPPGTSRVWRTTYMANNVRIVRAGKTGLPEDEGMLLFEL